MKALRCPKCYSADVSEYVDQTAFCYLCQQHFQRREELKDIHIELWDRSRAYDPEYLTTGRRSRVRRLWDRLAELLGFI